MTRDKDQKFSDKHGSDAILDEKIKTAILENTGTKEFPCAVAFKISAQFGVTPAEVGKTVDLMDFRITKCQLGLFGYQPQKKIVGAKDPQSTELEAAIKEKLSDGRISCQSVWQIAKTFGVTKMSVSAACEALNLKIKPCQLGAF